VIAAALTVYSGSVYLRAAWPTLRKRGAEPLSSRGAQAHDPADL
jgi:hypothetical protein